SVSKGFTGIIRYPACCMYSATPKLGRYRLLERPTTAIVCEERSSSETLGMLLGSRRPRLRGFGTSGICASRSAGGSAALTRLPQAFDLVLTQVPKLTRFQRT